MSAGLGGALALLKERGELNQSKAIIWSGRNNDMKPGKLQPVSDVFTGGNAEDEQANRIENALRRTDEFGRQKTPKEAWRELNHGCVSVALAGSCGAAYACYVMLDAALTMNGHLHTRYFASGRSQSWFILQLIQALQDFSIPLSVCPALRQVPWHRPQQEQEGEDAEEVC